MKLDIVATKTGAIVPPAAFMASGFGTCEDAECRAVNDCVVIMKKRMNASELIRAAWALHELSVDLSLIKGCLRKIFIHALLQYGRMRKLDPPVKGSTAP